MRKLLTDKIIYYLIVIQLIMLPFLPEMDSKMNLFRIINYTVFALLSIVIVISYLLKKKLKADISFRYIIAFFALCTLSGIWGLLRGIPIFDICRGIIPFVWLIYILILNQSFNDFEFKKILKLISYIALFYSIRIIIYYFIYVAGHPYERVTFHLVQATSVLPMIGTLIFLHNSLKRKRLFKGSLLLMLICYISVMMTETKSMLMALIIGILLFTGLLLINKSGLKDKRVTIINGLQAICILFITTLILFDFTGMGKRWGNTIKLQNDTGIEIVDEGSVSVRLIEFQTAINRWQISPILGQGIGYRWQAVGLDYGGPVIYMHNILMFILMDFGIIGIIYILFVIIGLLKLIIGSYKRKVPLSSEIYILFSSVVMSFIYANFFAVFRNIDFIVVCSILISMLIYFYNRSKENEVSE